MIITVVREDDDITARIRSGAAILNVASGINTPNIVKKIRDEFPAVPVIASGGPTDESIRVTIEAGANAITYTPPSAQRLFSEQMRSYREKAGME